jgi:hypothetical protein
LHPETCPESDSVRRPAKKTAIAERRTHIPKYYAMEAKHKANLRTVEQLKEKGDQAYKDCNFYDAITHYTRCIERLEKHGRKGSDLALKAYMSRAGKSVVSLCVTMVRLVWVVVLCVFC